MAALSAIHPTILDLTRRLDPDGRIAPIVEILNETQELMPYMTWMEGNLPTGNRTTVRYGIPEPTWRKLYGGVQPTKSHTRQVTDTCGMMEAYAEVDKALADLNGNSDAFRLSEDLAHIEGMAQEFWSTFFYGNELTVPASFTGLTPRYNLTTAENGSNLIAADASASGNDYTSMWLLGFGSNTLHGIVPKGSQTGWQRTYKGQTTSENIDGSNGRAEVYRTHYRWDCGLTVRDWRYAVRIYNIDVSRLTKDASSGADLIDLASQAVELIPSLSMCKPVFVCNRTVKSVLRRQIENKVKNSTLTMEQVGGKPVMQLCGIPVVRSDSLLNTEGTTAPVT